ncbi:MAG TPA: LpqB family beta-propeller domain-containing protein [Chitinophagaceae bacterium]
MNYSKLLWGPALAMALVSLSASGQPATTSSRPSYSEPALSPDGSEIAFVSGGDIWTVPSSGGEARLLVSNPATESRPLYSPDGKSLAFVSTRSGNGDIYVLHMVTGAVERLTWDDGFDEVSAWSRDGKYLYFSSTSRDIAGMRDVFRVKATGGTPVTVSGNRYVNEYFAAPAPDGKSVAFAARGFGSHQWWRKGHSHLDESELWLQQGGTNESYQQLTERGAKQLWPLWSADGRTLYYVADRNGQQNLWMLPMGGTAKQLTNFTTGRVLWPSIAHNGQSLVFERDFSVWKYDIANGQATPVSITRRGVPATPAVERSRLTSGFSNLALSPDGKKVAFVARGEVFVAGAKDGGDATRVTATTANEAQLAWTPNSNTLLYTSEREGVSNIYQYNFITGKETQLTSGRQDNTAPLLSPDGKQVAFIRDGKELRVLDLATKRETVVAQGYLGRPPFASSGSVSWSPDGKWLAYAAFGPKSLRNIMVVPAAGGTGRPISFLANTFGGNVVWSRDGKSILFTTAQRTENGYVARVDLLPRQPRFREDQFRDLFTEPAPAAARPASKTSPVIDTLTRNTTTASKGTHIVFEGIRQRLSLLPLGVDAGNIDLGKDGNTLVVVANVAGQSNLYTYSLDELSKEPAVVKQLTSTPGYKSSVQLSSDGKEVYFLEGGRILSVNLDSRQVKPLSVTAEMDIDFAAEKMEMFRQAWEVQNKGFYDTAFHGVDWAAIRTTYEPLAAGAQTPDELRRILNLMVGELNASHSGVSGPGQPTYSTGRIGLRFDPSTYEAEGKLKITEVVALSPAALTGSVQAGDYLVAIDGTPVTGDTNIDQLLDNKVGKRVTLSVSSSSSDKNPRSVVVRPVNQPTEKGLLYKQWVQERRDYVAKASGGRLGYVHMFDMGQGSLDQLYLDMDAENHARDGVVVDVRNNNGGFVNAYALDVLSRKGYLTMTVRGLPPAPARVQLGQRALDAPTILVTNQHSLSDAEDFAEGYRTLGLGKVVGEPTAGWIIYTSAASLIDGSSIRLPFIKITDNRGQNMEGAPRPVDIPVTNPLGEEDKDRQLDTAVKELLRQIDAAKK